MASKDLLEQNLNSGNLVRVTKNAVDADVNLNSATADISIRNLAFQQSLAEQATIAANANKTAIKTTASLTEQIAQKDKELQELDSGSKAYRALYALPVLNLIPMAIDANMEGKREEIQRAKETLEALNTGTVAQDNNLSLQTKAVELQKAVSTEEYIRAFQGKQDANAEIAGAEQNFKFLQSRLTAETEKLRQAQIGQSMAIAGRQELREQQTNEARQRLLLLQGDQAKAELDKFQQNTAQVQNIVDSFNKSTGSNLDVTSFAQLPDTQRTFIIQAQTGLLRTPEDMSAAWRAYGFTNNNINLLPVGLRDQMQARINFTSKVERDYYASQAANDPAGIRVRDQLALQYGEMDPKTGAPTGRVDYNKIDANFQENTAMDIADNSGQSFIMNPGNPASREIVDTMTAQNKLPKTFTDLIGETINTSLGLDNSEDKTLNATMDLIQKALAEQKAKSTELGISGFSPLMGTYQSPTMYGFSSEPVHLPLTDVNGNVSRTNLKQLIRGIKANINTRTNATAISGNASAFQILQNYNNSRGNADVNTARQSNANAIATDENRNQQTLDGLQQ